MIIALISKRDYYFINGKCGDFDFIGNTQRESQFWKNVKKMNWILTLAARNNKLTQTTHNCSNFFYLFKEAL